MLIRLAAIIHPSISVAGSVPNIESELTGSSNVGLFELGGKLWRTGDFMPQSMLQKIPSGGAVPKDYRILFEAMPSKCARMPKVIGPSNIQGLSRQDALRYGLLVTLDQDVIFTKGKGILSTTSHKGSDVMFFVAPPPKHGGVSACYRKVKGIHREEEEFEADTFEAVNDVADITPARDQQCLLGIPFAIVLADCDFTGFSFAGAVPVEQEWREKTVEASSVPSFIYKRHRELWPTREAIFYDYAGESGFKISCPSGKPTEPKSRVSERKKVISASWIDRVRRNEVLGHIPFDEAVSFGLGVRSHAEYKRAFGPSPDTYESFKTMGIGFLFMAATALPRVAESRSTKRIFGAWGITVGIIVLFIAWLNIEASHAEVLGGTVAAVVAVIYGVMRNTGPVSITWAEIGIGISTTVLLGLRNASFDWRAFELVNMTIAFVLALSSSVVTPSGRRVSTTAL